MMPAWEEFEAGGIRFRIKPLSVIDAEDLAAPLMELITPVAASLIAEGKSFQEVSQALLGISRALKQEKIFREKFVNVCQYLKTDLETPGWVDLKPMFEDVFTRQHLARYAWLQACIRIEFGDFLAAIGRPAMKKLEERLLTFLGGFVGASGESQPTPESKTPTPTSETAGPGQSS